MVTIWFEPHATSLDNEAKIASGWYNVELSELGYKQAQELADRCKDRGIEAIFCSDMDRSIKTAEPFAEQANIPMYTDERLRECNYGDMTRQPKEEIDKIKMKKISDSFPNGESYTDCALRVNEFLRELKNNFDGKTVLIVGHRATQYGLEARILRKALPDIVEDDWQWQPGWKYELN